MAGPSLGRMRPPCGAQSDNSGSDVRDGCRTAAAYMDTWRNSGAVAIRILPALFMTLKRSRSAAGLGRTTLQSPLLFCQRCPTGADPWTQAGQRRPHRRNKSVSRHWDPEGCSAWELSQRSFKPPETADQIPGAQAIRGGNRCDQQDLRPCAREGLQHCTRACRDG